jgi:hypothetical protein
MASDKNLIAFNKYHQPFIYIMCFLVDEEDKDSLQELAAEQKCFVEHILCTKPLPCR